MTLFDEDADLFDALGPVADPYAVPEAQPAMQELRDRERSALEHESQRGPMSETRRAGAEARRTELEDEAERRALEGLSQRSAGPMMSPNTPRFASGPIVDVVMRTPSGRRVRVSREQIDEARSRGWEEIRS